MTIQNFKNTTSLSPYGERSETRGSIKHNCRMDSRLRGNDRGECGRSMVEMLGTLAIIGVLSIGGIAGYSYGMDKYRANTIINDVMLRSVDALAQFDSTGDANLSEWPTTTVGKYTIGLENDTIGIQVSGLPKRLCKMVFDGLINNASIKIGAIEYDSATDDDVCGDTNTMVFYVDEAPLNTDNTENETNTGTMTTAITTTTTTVIKTDTCNCGVGQYCVDMSEDLCIPHSSITCKDLDFRETDIDGTTYYISNSEMTWWDAVSACKALGNKKLLSVYDFVEDFDNTNTASQVLTNTALGNTLYEKGWGSSNDPDIWSSTLYDSCTAFTIFLYNGLVYGTGLNSNAFAVCK